MTTLTSAGRSRSRANRIKIREAVLAMIDGSVSLDAERAEAFLPRDHPTVTDQEFQRELGRLYEDGVIVYTGGRYARS